MTSATSVLLIPFIVAFLVFIYRFYNREGAASIFNFSFLMAILTSLLAGTYLVLGIIGLLPSFGTILFACIGLGLLATAIGRLFMM
jgi:hypothetical protein